MELLEDYDCSILYHRAKANVVANAVSENLAGGLVHISIKKKWTDNNGAV